MKKQLEFDERDYVSRVDLIVKVQGLQKAGDYIQTVPISFRGELLLLYKKFNKKKIDVVLLLMEKENIKPSPFTYKILIVTKGLCNDIAGIDQIVETMKAESFEPDIITQLNTMPQQALRKKAEEVLKALEGEVIKQNRWGCRFLLPLYAELRKADEVERIWKDCESKPRFEEYLAAVEAWGKLGQVEKSEAVFDRLLETSKKLPAKHYTKMLKVYSYHKMMQKGKDLVKRMVDNGCQIGPLTWDALVKLYVEAGEVEKADSILQKACRAKEAKPMFTSFMVVMEQERMLADNIFPNKSLVAQLAQVDVFRRTSLSDLLKYRIHGYVGCCPWLTTSTFTADIGFSF
ncbi:Detected protein of confused Function [Hibiscus syriacus]|uniref:Detected protein of confused Function n=1 Tax=Hibiscus syriacus TaxID=106335 RepID=A0A6A3CRE2_HIBSY|nr:Detected protein of confused Function [Hibiscus syriacus]